MRSERWSGVTPGMRKTPSLSREGSLFQPLGISYYLRLPERESWSTLSSHADWVWTLFLERVAGVSGPGLWEQKRTNSAGLGLLKLSIFLRKALASSLEIIGETLESSV